MKFNFYEKESKLYDLLQFPRILFVKHNVDGYGEEANLFPIEKLDNQKHLDMAERVVNKLKPLKEEIDLFYANEFLSSYDFFSLLTDMYSFFGCETIDDYMKKISDVQDEKLKEDLIYALLTSDDDLEEMKEDLKEKAKDFMNKQDKLMQFIKELPTESSFRWNIMMVLENPKKMLKKFHTLMKQIEPIFEGFYQENKEEIVQCRNRLEDLLKDNPKENFRSLTQNMVDDDLLEEENNILISFVFAYSFVDKKTTYKQVYVWGINMEEGFKVVSKQYGDRIEKITKVFKILGDKTRYEVLKLIASGVTSTKVIAKELGVTSATISYHINSFITNNVISLSKAGQHKYDVDFEMLNSLWDNFISDLSKNND